MMQISVSLNKKRAIEENETISENQKCFYKADNRHSLKYTNQENLLIKHKN